MKHHLVIAVLFAIFAVSVISAQDTVTQAPAEDDIALLAISSSLRVMTRVNSDPKLNSVAELFFEIFTKEIAGSELPAEMASMKDLAKATPARRTEILADLRVKILKDISVFDEVWQFSVGEVLGDLMAESLKRSGAGLSEPALYQVNLLKLKDLMKDAPKAFPSDLLAKLKEIAEFGEEDSLDNNELLDQIDKKIEKIEDIVLGSP